MYEVCEHGSMRRKCEVCDLAAEVSTLRAALRGQVIREIRLRKKPHRDTCDLCGRLWVPGQPEQHDDDCIAR